MWKDFLYYTRSERRGIIVLLVLTGALIGLSLLLPSSEDEGRGDWDTARFMKEYERFVHSIEVLDKKEYYKFFHHSFYRHTPVVLAPFNPNTADSATFLRLGLKPWMAHNILKYRAKGGKFRKAEDFKKIYGLSEEQYAMLLPYIDIPMEKKDTVRLLAVRDTTRRYPVKYTTPVKMELNDADTTELKKIPGVGSGIARMIVHYRQKLGGYYSIRQLDEIHLISANLAKWFNVNPSRIVKINLNKAGIHRLNAHPYIDFYQAKVIIEYRRKHGTIKGLNQLSLYQEFTQQDFERLKYYASFD